MEIIVIVPISQRRRVFCVHNSIRRVVSTRSNTMPNGLINHLTLRLYIRSWYCQEQCCTSLVIDTPAIKNSSQASSYSPRFQSCPFGRHIRIPSRAVGRILFLAASHAFLSFSNTSGKRASTTKDSICLYLVVPSRLVKSESSESGLDKRVNLLLMSEISTPAH